jgi:hypothetical protein
MCASAGVERSRAESPAEYLVKDEGSVGSRRLEERSKDFSSFNHRLAIGHRT